MRMKKPRRASMDEVKITREGEYAVIENADPTVSVMQLKIGTEIQRMSDQGILDLFNDVIASQDQLRAEHDNVVTEIPPGRPQIEYAENADQWVPRGDVLRCYVEDNEDGEAVIHIDDHELSLRDFGRLLTTHAGWGMRISFVDEESIYEEPEVIVRDPPKGER